MGFLGWKDAVSDVGGGGNGWLLGKVDLPSIRPQGKKQDRGMLPW